MQSVVDQYTPVILGSNSTTQVKKGNGIAGRFIPSASGTIAIYDNASGDTANVIMASTAVVAGTAMTFSFLVQNGITVILGGGAAGTFGYV